MNQIYNNKYPKVNYIGNKEKLCSWICEHLPKDIESITDAFSGGSSFGFEAKKRGLKVVSNDILKVNSILSKAFIENNSCIIEEKDLEVIFKGKPFEGFMTKNYSEKFFFKNECKDLDLYYKNILTLNCEYKQALSFALLRRAMIRKMPYSRFTIDWDTIKQLRDEEYSYKTYGRRRAYHNQSFKEHFLENLQEYNNSIFDNKKNNLSLNLDVFKVISNKEYSTDAIYLDPPYAGTMNNYFGFYGLIDNYILKQKTEQFSNNFMSKKEIVQLFDNLFSNLSNYKYWILSYNNSATPSKQEIIDIISKYSKKITVVEKEHVYKVTSKEKKNENTEYLFIIEG